MFKVTLTWRKSTWFSTTKTMLIQVGFCYFVTNVLNENITWLPRLLREVGPLAPLGPVTKLLSGHCIIRRIIRTQFNLFRSLAQCNVLETNFPSSEWAATPTQNSVTQLPVYVVAEQISSKISFRFSLLNITIPRMHSGEFIRSNQGAFKQPAPWQLSNSDVTTC